MWQNLPLKPSESGVSFPESFFTINLFFLIDTGLFFFIPYIQSISKSNWLDLQKYIQNLTSFYHLLSYLLGPSIHNLLLDYCHNCLAGLFASALALYSLFSLQWLLSCLMWVWLCHSTKPLPRVKVKSLAVGHNVPCGLALHYPNLFSFFYAHSHLSPHLLFLKQAKHMLPQGLCTCLPLSA